MVAFFAFSYLSILFMPKLRQKWCTVGSFYHSIYSVVSAFISNNMWAYRHNCYTFRSLHHVMWDSFIVNGSLAICVRGCLFALKIWNIFDFVYYTWLFLCEWVFCLLFVTVKWVQVKSSPDNGIPTTQIY